MTDQQKKYAKIAVIAVVVIVVIYLLYTYFGGGNAYASGSALKAIKGGGKGTWSEQWPSDVDAVNKTFSAIDPAIVWPDAGPLPNWSKGCVYGAAWCKGMGIAYSSANGNEFKSEISKYVKNASLRKPHWEVSVGEFLSAK